MKIKYENSRKSPTLSESPWVAWDLSRICQNAIKHDMQWWSMYNIPNWNFGMLQTYCPSTQCQLLFFACFLHRRKSIPNGVQTQRNSTKIFMDQKEPNGPELHLGGAPREAQPTRARQGLLARPGGLCPPRWPPAPPLCTINSQIFRHPSGLP